MTPRRNIISLQQPQYGEFDRFDPDISVQFNFVPTCQQPMNNVNMGPAVGFYNPSLGHVPNSCRFIPGYVYPPPYVTHGYQFHGPSWGYINAMPVAGAYPYFPQPMVPAHIQPQMQASSCPRQINLMPGIPSFQPLSQLPMHTGFYRRRDQVMQSENTSFLDMSRLNEMEDVVDEHVGMRLDIDGMSYEELLDLEVRIGDVQTGLSKDFILDNLKTHMYEIDGASSDSCASWADICIICQGEYDVKDCIGTLDCGHRYHSDCIKQWLKLKNQCPICKQVALTNNR